MYEQNASASITCTEERMDICSLETEVLLEGLKGLKAVRYDSFLSTLILMERILQLSATQSSDPYLGFGHENEKKHSNCQSWKNKAHS